MKFVCDKCKTKYSIADERVRRKVLKIRCKNCSNIIIVREPTRSSAAPQPRERSRSGPRPLEDAFDGAFKPRPTRPKRPASSPMPSVQGVPDMASDEFEPEPTRLSDVPDFVDEFPPKEEDEWFLAVDGNQYGPMAVSELCSRVKRGEAGDEAYVWRDGFDDWMDVQDVPELRPYVPRHPPPPPRGKSGLYPAAALAQSPMAPPVPQSSPGLVPPRTASSSFRQVPTRQDQVHLQPAPPPVHPVATPQHGSQVAAVPVPRPQTPSMPPTYQDLPPAPVPVAPALQVDSDLKPLPPMAPAPLAPVADITLAPPAPAPAPGRTPLWMIIAGIGGGLAALCGVFLVGYSLFIERSTDNKSDPTKAVASVSPPVRPVPAPDAMAVAQAEPDPEIEFPPMEVERSKSSSRVVRRRAKTTTAKSPSRPALTAEQKRLMKLYNKSGPSAAAPSTGSARRSASSGFKRAIRPVELLALQRRNKASLKACYERALKRDQTLTELKAEVTVSIGDSGVVRSVKIRAGDNVDLVACIKRSIRRWAFPAVGAQTFAFPIIFRGS